MTAFEDWRVPGAPVPPSPVLTAAIAGVEAAVDALAGVEVESLGLPRPHDTPWSHGGHTDLDDARLLCHRHHRVIHDPRYDTTGLPDGTVRFHRRT